MTFSVPILLLIWRRPAELFQVIRSLRTIAPSRLFVACDGPNPSRHGDPERVAVTRALIENEIDWPCQIQRLYSDTNQGCRLGVSRAITWFFDHVDEGIILEDDCVPHPDFFSYCSSLLERYRYDDRIWCISGSNFQKGNWRGDGSYYFSRYNHCWGWASWSRCWKRYDDNLLLLPALQSSGLLNSIFDDPLERKYWNSIWDLLFHESKPDSWAYRWTFTCIVNGGLTALPNRNLVANIGFGVEATHTTGPQIPTPIDLGLGPLVHPSFMIRDKLADAFTFDHVFGGREMRRSQTNVFRLRMFILRFAQFFLHKIRKIMDKSS